MVPLLPQSVSIKRPPRLASMEPRPDDVACCQWAGPGSAVSAWATSMRPLPCTPALMVPIGSAVLVSRAFTWSGVRSGRADSSTAAAPEATAAACEDPLPRM